MLSNLTRLQLGGHNFFSFCAWDAKWVASLSALRHLEHLEMRMVTGNAPLPLLVPALPSLTFLLLQAPEGLWGVPEGNALRVDLAGLPRLQVLTLLGYCWAEIMCSEVTDLGTAWPSKADTTPAVQELYLHYMSAEVDFGAMPNLRLAWLEPQDGINGAYTLARATALEVRCSWGPCTSMHWEVRCLQPLG